MICCFSQLLPLRDEKKKIQGKSINQDVGTFKILPPPPGGFYTAVQLA